MLFEPIPETFAMLRTNADRLLQGADVTLVPKAVSSTVGTVTFETHPRSSFEASAYSDQAKAELRAARRADPGAWFRAGVQDARRAELVPERAARLIEGALDNRVARPVVIGGFTLAGTLGSLGRRFRSQRLECPTTTISAAMREHGIDRIDLLKIDVEGAEWDALVGIEEPDWPRIRQLAIEVHDVDGRVARIRDLLERMGYEVAVEEEDWETLRLRGLHMVFASRWRAGRPGGVASLAPGRTFGAGRAAPAARGHRAASPPRRARPAARRGPAGPPRCPPRSAPPRCRGRAASAPG